MAAYNLGGFFNVPKPPDWNANTSALGKELYPDQADLGPGEWGYKDPTQAAKLTSDWQAAQPKPQRRYGFGSPLGFGGFGTSGGGSMGWANPFNFSGAWGELGGK